MSTRSPHAAGWPRGSVPKSCWTPPRNPLRSSYAISRPDVCIEFSGHYPALQEAIRTVAYSSRVVSAGYYQGDGSALRLGEEFHHNRVNVVASQIFGVAPQLLHRWDAYRLASTVVSLATSGSLNVIDLISHEFAAEDAQSAFELLDSHTAQALQVVLAFGGGE